MGIFDGLTNGQGLLGLGGMGNNGMPAGAMGSMGGLLDPAALQKYKLKNLLLGAGINMLSQGPSSTPIDFGSTLGKGLAGGLTAAQAAQQDYVQNAKMAWDMKRQQSQDQMAQNADKRAQGLYEPQLYESQAHVAGDKALTDFINKTVTDPTERSIALSDKTAFANNYWAQKSMKQRYDLAVGSNAAIAGTDSTIPQSIPQPLGSSVPTNFGPRAQGAAPSIVAQPNQSVSPEVQQFVSGPANPSRIPIPPQLMAAANNASFSNPGNGAEMLGAYISQQQQNSHDDRFKTPEYISSVETAKSAACAKGTAAADYMSMASKYGGLVDVVKKLDTLSKDATYTQIGQLGDAIRTQTPGASPSKGALARTNYEAIVNNQILPLLRDTFGAQFTEREGQTLRETLGNPDKTPQEKQVVLQSFIDQKKRDIVAKANQAGLQAPDLPDLNLGSSAGTNNLSDQDLLKMYGG